MMKEKTGAVAGAWEERRFSRAKCFNYVFKGSLTPPWVGNFQLVSSCPESRVFFPKITARPLIMCPIISERKSRSGKDFPPPQKTCWVEKLLGEPSEEALRMCEWEEKWKDRKINDDKRLFVSYFIDQTRENYRSLWVGPLRAEFGGQETVLSGFNHVGIKQKRMQHLRNFFYDNFFLLGIKISFSVIVVFVREIDIFPL